MSTDIVVIIQARMGSSRFPRKSMAEINGRPILSYMMEQLSHCRMPDAVVLAIPAGAGGDVQLPQSSPDGNRISSTS